MSSEQDLVALLTDIRNLLFDVARVQRKILTVYEENARLDGTTITNTFILPLGQQVTKMDFVEANHRNVPPNVSFDVPLVPVAHLKITNFGPGLILYSTNKGLSQLEAAEQIVAGESAKIRLKKRAIKQLNIVANNQPAKVRVTVLV